MEYWCEMHQGVFTVPDGDDPHTIKAKFHEGFITVCNPCYDAQLDKGLYDEEGEWRRRAAKAARDIGWQETPFPSLVEACALAATITHATPIEVDEPGFAAFLVGDWLLAQRDKGGPVMQLQLGPTTGRVVHKVRPAPKDPEVRTVSPLCNKNGVTSLAGVKDEWRDKRMPDLGIMEGRFICFTTEGGDRYWYFEQDHSDKVFAFVERNLLYPNNPRYKRSCKDGD